MRNEDFSYKLFKVINYTFMVILIIVILFPYLNVFAVALSDSSKVNMTGLMVIPKSPTIQNFKVLFLDKNLVKSFIITISRLFTGVILTLTVEFMAAYAISKKNLPGRKQFTIFLMLPMYISGGLVPTYILFSKIGLLNNFLVYVLPFALGFYEIIIMRTYLYTIPESLEESAKLDGASHMRILWNIYFPLSAPIIATCALFQCVFHWNDWTTTLYFVTNRRLYSLQYVLVEILRESERMAKVVQEAILKGMMPPETTPSTTIGIRSAQIILTTLPIILFYPFLQKYFIKGMLIGGVKE